MLEKYLVSTAYLVKLIKMEENCTTRPWVSAAIFARECIHCNYYFIPFALAVARVTEMIKTAKLIHKLQNGVVIKCNKPLSRHTQASPDTKPSSLVDKSINQLINQSVSQSVSQSVNQSVN